MKLFPASSLRGLRPVLAGQVVPAVRVVMAAMVAAVASVETAALAAMASKVVQAETLRLPARLSPALTD